MTEWDATDYNRISTLQKLLAEEHLALIKLQGNERILDIGCGDGKVTARIAAHVPRGSVLGVDPSVHMIEFAASHFASPQHANLRFQVADARTLPFRNEFDLIVSFNALHWVREQEAALRSIRNALTPAGRAVLEFVPGGDRRALEDVIEAVRHLPRWAKFFEGFQQPFAHFLPDEYRGMAGRCGLKVVHLEVEHRSWEFGSREAFAAFCHGTFIEWLRRVQAELQSTFIADVLDRYQVNSSTMSSIFRFYQMVIELKPV
jgi:ubiquinone/menaquinone biosynthesis C-methylase UbiE